MNWQKIIIAAIIYTVIAHIFHYAGVLLTMDYYTNPLYFPLWSKLMMPEPGAPPTGFFIATLVVNLAIGFVFAGMYSILKKAVPGKKLRKGVNYGIILFFLTCVPWILVTYLLLAVPEMLLLAWTAESLIIYTLGGMAFSKLL